MVKKSAPFVLPAERKCAIYLRFSTPGQKDNSIFRQDELTESYRTDMGLPEAQVFKDKAKSGYSAERSGFQDLIAFCYENHGTDLIIESPSRLVRDGFPYTEIQKLRRLTGLRVHSVLNGGLLDEYQEQILVAQAGQEYRLAAYYMRAGWLQKAHDGKWVHKKPWGSYVDEDECLQIDPDKKQVIIDIFNMRASGVPVRGIIKDLQNRAPHMKGTVGWTPSGINSILGSKAYTGHIRYRRKKFQWERSMFKTQQEAQSPYKSEFDIFMEQLAIIPLSLWERVQHKPRKVPHRGFSKLFLAGIAKCPVCNEGLTGTWGDEKPIYLCKNPACSQRDRFDAKTLEGIVFNAIGIVCEKTRADDAFSTAIEDELEMADAQIAESRRVLDRAIVKLESEYARLRKSIGMVDDILKPDFQEDLKSAKERLMEAQANREALPLRPALLIVGDAFPSLPEAIVELASQLPLMRTDAPSAALHGFLKEKLVVNVVLQKGSGSAYDAKIDLCVAEGPSGPILRTVQLKSSVHTIARFRWDEFKAKHAERIRQGVDPLSDDEFVLLSDVDSIGELSSVTNKWALEAVLTPKVGERASLAELLKASKAPKPAIQAANWLLGECDLDEIERRLSVHRGETVEIRRYPSNGERSVAMRLAEDGHPLLLLKLAYQGNNAAKMTDEQFEAVKPFLPGFHNAWRRRLNTLFHILRFNLSWYSGLRLQGTAIRKLEKLHLGGRLRNIVGALLKLEGWHLPDDFVVAPLRAEEGKKLHDLEEVRANIAAQLTSTGGVYDYRPQFDLVRFGNLEIDPTAGVIRNAKGETERFTPWPRMKTMLAEPCEWIPWAEDRTESMWRIAQFRIRLARLGWKAGRTDLITSRLYGTRMVFRPQETGKKGLSKAA